MQHRQRCFSALAHFVCLTLLSACAGPMDPFGAKPIAKSVLQEVEFEESEQSQLKVEDIQINGTNRMPASIAGATIDFYPPRKLWHRAFDLSITIKDKEGFAPNSKIIFYYGGEDVTERILSFARTKYNGDGTQVRFTIPTFRLLPDQDKALIVTYAKLDPLGFDQVIGKVYEEPYCPMMELQSIATPTNLKGFQATNKLIDQIHSLSTLNQMNPALIAGLIAQESSFDSRAVSSAKAIGLTQITSPAEHHILDSLGERAADWPRYPGIESMNPVRIKALVALGRINSSNEWRLADDRSIQGGISYLKYIQQYWRSFSPMLERKLASLPRERRRNEVVDIILASYNSGPYRVRKNLDRLGAKWLEASDLGEARKYVHNVKSYCYDFARGY